jgi:hypothetical protein
MPARGDQVGDYALFWLMSLPAPKAVARTLLDIAFVPQAAVSNCSKAAPYSITSSARASSAFGTVRPSVLAVLRLITSSYLVGGLYGQVGRFLALEDAVNVRGRAPVRLDRIKTIGDQPATGNEEAQGIRPQSTDTGPRA